MRTCLIVSTFIWISDTAAVDTISTYLQDATNIEKATGKKQGNDMLRLEKVLHTDTILNF